MRRHLSTGRVWCRTHAPQLEAVAFYAPACIPLIFGLLAMLDRAIPTSSDGLWVFSFAHDLILGIPIQGWKQSALPLYFPELVSILTWQSLGFDVAATFIIHGLLTWLLVSAGVVWGLRTCGVSFGRALRAAFVTLLVYVALYCGSQQLSSFQYPYSHGGSTLGTFLGIVYVADVLAKGYRVPSAFAATVCLGLLVASDRAIIAQFILPAACVVAVFLGLRAGSRRTLAGTLGLLASGVGLGGLIGMLVKANVGLAPVALHGSYSWSAARSTLQKFTADMGLIAAERPAVFASSVLPLALLGLSAVEGVRRRWRERFSPVCLDLPMTPAALAALWIGCAGVACLSATTGAVILGHFWVGLTTLRYILPLLVLPLALAVIVFGTRLPILSGNVARSLELALVVTVAIITRQVAGTNASGAALMYRPQTACLDTLVREEGLHSGFAGYWQGRPAMVSSRVHMTLGQVGPHLAPHRWLNNAFWYTRGYWPSDGPPRYDFAITNGLDDVWLRKRFGAPRAKRTCFGQSIWVYDRPEDFEFRNYLRANAARIMGDRAGIWESPTLALGVVAPRKGHSFDGARGLLVEFPRVSANILELVSPTRKPLHLTYRRDGHDIADERVTFAEKDQRRLIALPPSLTGGFDSVLVRGEPGTRYRLREASLMLDLDLGLDGSTVKPGVAPAGTVEP